MHAILSDSQNLSQVLGPQLSRQFYALFRLNNALFIDRKHNDNTCTVTISQPAFGREMKGSTIAVLSRMIGAGNPLL